jgi:hypothetical protein
MDLVLAVKNLDPTRPANVMIFFCIKTIVYCYDIAENLLNWILTTLTSNQQQMQVNFIFNL